jgi:hypothetical protein
MPLVPLRVAAIVSVLPYRPEIPLCQVLCVASLCVLSLSIGLMAQQAGWPSRCSPATAPPPTCTSAEVLAMHADRLLYQAHRRHGARQIVWQPTPEVRSYARLFAHIVDDCSNPCAALAGVTPAPAYGYRQPPTAGPPTEMARPTWKRRSPIQSPSARRPLPL